MLNLEKVSKWILIPACVITFLFIISLTAFIGVCSFQIYSGKLEINITPIITTLLVTIFAPFVGVKTFLGQQRVARMQKIYYEDSLLHQMKNLDDTINITEQNIIRFENCINLVKTKCYFPCIGQPSEIKMLTWPIKFMQLFY